MISYPDLLMCNLPISTLLHDCHDNVLGGHERQLLKNVPLDDLRIHHQPLRYILQRLQNDITRQKRFRECNPSVRPSVLHQNHFTGAGFVGTDESSRVLSNHCTLDVMTAFW